tara:strand:- start:90 stop:239 length:150 start_codon:yes stop_codon:yes gene_type:complete
MSDTETIIMTFVYPFIPVLLFLLVNELLRNDGDDDGPGGGTLVPVPNPD